MPRTKSQYKCTNCGNLVDAELVQVIGGKKYCPQCSVARTKEVRARTKINELIDKHYGADYIPRFSREINVLLEAFPEWTLSGVACTLDYVFNIVMKEETIHYNPDTGIRWLIENYYPEAKKFAAQKQEIKQSLVDTNLEDFLHKEVVEVRIKRSDINKMQEQFYEQRQDMIYGPELKWEDLDNLEVYTDEQED